MESTLKAARRRLRLAILVPACALACLAPAAPQSAGSAPIIASGPEFSWDAMYLKGIPKVLSPRKSYASYA